MNDQELKDIRRKIIKEVISVEGGYVNDPSDSGGETKFGITKKVAASHGFYVVNDLTQGDAFEIYEADYWHPLILDEVLKIASEDIAAELFDTGVNTGPSRAVKFLQRSLNSLNNGGSLYPDISVDGGMGAQTLGALRGYFAKRGQRGAKTLYNVLNSMQSMFYVELSERRPKDERFNHGWQANRVSLLDTHDRSDFPVYYDDEDQMRGGFDRTVDVVRETLDQEFEVKRSELKSQAVDEFIQSNSQGKYESRTNRSAIGVIVSAGLGLLVNNTGMSAIFAEPAVAELVTTVAVTGFNGVAGVLGYAAFKFRNAATKFIR